MAKAVRKKHPYPTVNYRFQVLINSASLGFSRISNLEESVETESLQVWGLNGYVVNLRKPSAGERVLSLERGLAFRGKDDTKSLPSLTPGMRIFTDIIIVCHGSDGRRQGVFIVQGATVRKVSYSDLDATGNQVVIERLELVYEKMEQSLDAEKLLEAEPAPTPLKSAPKPPTAKENREAAEKNKQELAAKIKEAAAKRSEKQAALEQEKKKAAEEKKKLADAKRAETEKAEEEKKAAAEAEKLDKEMQDPQLEREEKAALGLKSNEARAKKEKAGKEREAASKAREEQEKKVAEQDKKTEEAAAEAD